MSIDNAVLSSSEKDPAIEKRNAVRSLTGYLGDAEVFARLTIVTVIVGVIVASLTAWAVDNRITDLLLSEVAQRAIDQVQLGVESHVMSSDFQPPFTQSRIDNLARRLDPLFDRLQKNGVIRLNVLAPDGTIIYSDNHDIRGMQISPDRDSLNLVLAGSPLKKITTLTDVENADLQSQFGGALEVYVPVVIDGQVVGVYEIYQDLAPLRPASRLIWISVLGILVPMFLVLFIIARGATRRIRHQQAERERLLQHVAEADALRVLGRAKSDLLGAVSHELRTPLSLVHGYSELLAARASEFDRRQIKEIASEINRGSTMMAHIVDDLLDFSRIERGRLRLELRETDLVAVARETLDLFREHGDAERIVFHAPPVLMLTVDPVRIRQVIANLVSNALRYATSGPINVRVALSADAEQAVLEVRDRGPGISPEALPHIWEMFYRAPEAVRSPVSGTGIGLALVKNLVEAHGGSVEVESEPNKGAMFRVCLPLRRHNPLAEEVPTTQLGRRVPVGSLVPSLAGQRVAVAARRSMSADDRAEPGVSVAAYP